jgi:membrane protease YdiL (CAAX protease family)
VDIPQPIFLAIVFGAVLAAIGVYWVLSRLGPRGAVLVLAATLYLVGFAAELTPWRKLAGPFGILRLVGGIGMILGATDLVRRLLTAPPALPPALPPPTEARVRPPVSVAGADQAGAARRPGLWAAVAWCLVLVAIVRVLPAHIAEMVSVPNFIERGVVVDWRNGHPFSGRAARVDMGAVRHSGGYASAAALVTVLGHAAAIVVVCLLLRADDGPQWPRKAGLVSPRPAHLLAMLIGVPGLCVVFMGIGTLLTNVLGNRLPWDGLEFTRSQWSLSAPLLMIVVLSTIVAGELWFRAYIGGGLVERFGTVPGVLMTSALFALVRLDPGLMLPAFLLGVVVHMAYLATRSLAIPILMYGVVTLAVAPASRMHVMPGTGMPATGYAAAIGLVVIAGVILYRTRVPSATVAQAG